MARLLEGTLIRDQILNELRPRIENLKQRARPPGIAVVLVGHNPASEIYVRNKVKTCENLGIYSEIHRPPEHATTEQLIGLIHELNARPDIDGILVQMPLPPHVDAKAVLHAVAPEKDVDGFHPLNTGLLVANQPAPRPCTPAGILEMLRRYEIPVEGRRVVVVGRSDIVGKPAALMFLHENATVTICHSRTRDLAAVCREAEILVAAIGRPAMITQEYIRDQAVVIDVGINRLTDRATVEQIFGKDSDAVKKFEQKGSILVGDVHPVHVAERASAYTPVPGGVGPLTIAMLMVNAVELAERRLGQCSK